MCSAKEQKASLFILYSSFILREFHKTYLLDHCLSYFGFAMIRHNVKGNL